MSKALAMLFALMGLATAAHGASTGVTPAMAALPFARLGDVTSLPGESLRAFLTRLALTLGAFTSKTGWEACATIGQTADGTFGVRLGTNKAQVGCLAGLAGTLDGMTWTGETIHSHSPGDTLEVSATDKAYAAATGGSLDNTFYNSPNGFSGDDYAGAPGYLVTPNHRLLYQNGHTRHGIDVGSW